MKFFRKILSAIVSFVSGPGARMLHDVGGAIVEQIGPALFAELVDLAKREVLKREVSVASNEKRNAQVAAILKVAARAAGSELSDTMCDIIIKGALLLIRQARS